jgi:hypothetical protein
MNRKNNTQNFSKKIALGRLQFLKKMKKPKRNRQTINTNNIVSKLSNRCNYTHIANSIKTTLNNTTKKKNKNLPKLTLSLVKNLSNTQPDDSQNNGFSTMSQLRPIFDKMTLKVFNDGQMAAYNPVIEIYSITYLLDLLQDGHINHLKYQWKFQQEYRTLNTIYQQESVDVIVPDRYSDISIHSLIEGHIAICYDVMLDPKPYIKNIRTEEELISFATNNRQILYIPPAIKFEKINTVLRRQLIKKKFEKVFTKLERRR